MDREAAVARQTAVGFLSLEGGVPELDEDKWTRPATVP